MIVFKNGTVITGDGKTLLQKGHVIVKGTKIIEVTENLILCRAKCRRNSGLQVRQYFQV